MAEKRENPGLMWSKLLEREPSSDQKRNLIHAASKLEQAIREVSRARKILRDAGFKDKETFRALREAIARLDRAQDSIPQEG